MLKVCAAVAIALPLAAHAAAPAPACFSGEFAPFLVAYANDIAVQRAHTLVPLKSKYLVDGDPDPKAVVKMLAKNQIVFPVMPLKAERVRTPLQMEVKALSATSAKVTLEKPDTDYVLSYHFRKNPCWQLVLMDNASL